MDKLLTLKKIIAGNAYRLRKAADLSQAEVSKAATDAGFKIDQKTVSRIEGGLKDEFGDPIYENPTFAKIAAVAVGVGAQPWQLLIPENVTSFPKTDPRAELLEAAKVLNEEGLRAAIKHAQFLATDPAYLAAPKGKRK